MEAAKGFKGLKETAKAQKADAYADAEGREACKGACWNGSMGELDGSLLRPSLSLNLNDPLIVIHWSSATLSLQPPNHFLPA